MDTKMNTQDALADFLEWIKDQPSWANIPRSEKQYMYITAKRIRDAKEGKAAPVGNEWARRMLEKYAPDRYHIDSGVQIRMS